MNDGSIVALRASYALGQIGKADFIAQALSCHRLLFDYVKVIHQTDVTEIVITKDGVRFELGSEAIRLFAPEGEARVAPLEIMNFDRYEPSETRVMDFLSQGAKVILDVGANIGWYATRFAKRSPSAKVFAFEPMPTSYLYLQRNVAENSLGDRVTCYNFGLSNKAGCFEYYSPVSGGTNASLMNVSNAQNLSPVLGLTLTMDQWLANHGQMMVDFIKCDVEGAELLVFQGGQSVLQQQRPVVFAEMLRKWAKPFGYHPNDMIAFFHELGYVCYGVGEQGVRRVEFVNDETVETNYAFVHEVHHAHLIDALNEWQ
ncbi:FkbM family methyltransferase [Chitinibacteraceae bacterium HSL-7]